MTSQILDSISDVRRTESFTLTDAGGALRDVEIHEYVTADDLMRHGVRAEIARRVTGETYQSIMDYAAITSLIKTQVPVVRR